MSKFCTKCGTQMHEDDFLCPSCGAIWGDRIYRHTAPFDTENAETADTEAPYTEPTDEPTDTIQKMQPRWIPIIATLCLVLAFGLFLIGSDFELWAGEGSSAPPTTTDHITIGQVPTTLPPEVSAATLPSAVVGVYVEYTVQIVDPFGLPIPGVEIEDPLGSPVISSYLPSYVTDEEGTVTFKLPIIGISFGNIEPYVRILSVPEGYSKALVGKKQLFDEGQRLKTIVVDFEYTEEIDPPVMDYSLTISSDEWLYEPLQTDYEAGEMVSVKIRYENGQYTMLFANGREITDCTLWASVTGDTYWKYTFEMPARSVELRVRAFSIDDRHPASAELLCAYYRQNPSANDTELLAYYGQYGDAIVGMLDIYSGSGGISIEKIDGYQFYYMTNNKITALINGEFLSLRKAYEDSYLTSADLKAIYDLHKSYF